MVHGLIFFTALSTVIAANRYQLGLWLMLVVGLIADPIRKLTPDNPIFISIAFVPIFIVVFLKASSAHRSRKAMFHYFPRLRSPFRWFLLFLCINTIRPLLEDINSLPLVLYSLTQYAGLFLAIYLGYSLVEREEDIFKYTKIYAVTITPFLLTTIPHFFGLHKMWPALRTMGFMNSDYLVFVGDMNMVALNGLFRGPEQMGWHAMVGVCCVLFLLFRKGIRSHFIMNWFGYPLFIFLGMFCTIVSGRRKFFFGVLVFLAISLLLLMQKNLKIAVSALLAVLILGGIGAYYLNNMTADEARKGYIYRIDPGLDNLKNEAGNRAVGSISSALRRDGFLGRGLGAATQGAHHFGHSMISASWNIESGPGKIVSEIGVPGILAFIMLIFSAFFGAYKNLRLNAGNMGLLTTRVFLIALPATFLFSAMVSHQTYADPLVAALTGISFGFMLASPKICDVKTSK